MNVGQLISALQNDASDITVLGDCELSETLEIKNNVTIRAANGQDVLLDGRNENRVLKILAGTVRLIGLNIVGGSAGVSAAACPDPFSSATSSAPMESH